MYSFGACFLFVKKCLVFGPYRPEKEIFYFIIESDEWFRLFRSAIHWLSDERLSDERKGKLKKWTHERQRSRVKNWVESGKRTSKKWASAQLCQYLEIQYLRVVRSTPRWHISNLPTPWGYFRIFRIFLRSYETPPGSNLKTSHDFLLKITEKTKTSPVQTMKRKDPTPTT